MWEPSELAMKHHGKHSFVVDDQAEQMGADMAIQFMLMMLFQIVSQMADDPGGFRSDVHKELTSLVTTYELPPMSEETARKIRAAARKILDGIMLRSFEQSALKRVS
jgi:hypothetical protein